MNPIEGNQAESLLKMIDVLEDNDDVQNVFANFDISEEEIGRILG
jgi:transcriptional/translational regulatory protein YebC/TACO1